MKKTKAIETQLSKLEDVRLFFENLKESKESANENKSEKWQESEAGEKAQEDVQNLENIIDATQSVIDDVENAFESD